MHDTRAKSFINRMGYGGRMMAAGQSLIEQFGTYSEPMLHSPGDCKFHIENGVWIGTCQHYTKHKNPPKEPCRHVQAHLLHELRQTQKWLDFKSQWKSKAEFETFSQAIECLTIYKSEEMNWLSRIVLSIAYSRGSANGDDLFEINNGPASKPQVMSAVWSSLITKGLIKCVGRRQSERSVNRGDQGIYILTEEGMELMQNLRKN
jgi:hypothetical protein